MTTVVVLPPALARRLSPAERADLFAYAAPDALLVPDPVYRPERFAPDGTPVLSPDGELHRFDDVALYTVRDTGDLATLSTWADRGDLPAHTYVVSDLLSLSVDRDALTTTLEGERPYRLALGEVDAALTHCSTAIPADYGADWDGLFVRGCAPVETQGAPAVPVLTFGGDGVVAVDEVGIDRLGIRAVPGVGEKRAETLREAGYSRAALAEADVRELADLPGFGRETAQSVVRGARAVELGELTRLTDAALPSRPVFVDIETDGLSPSVVWQVGVMGPDGGYEPFVAETPEEGPAMLDAVLDHLRSLGGTLVAWNGWGFDYPVLERFVVDWCPEREADWNRCSKFDPLRWARDEGNAVLPGRTNRLADVAEALGWEGDDGGLTGAATARAYRAWVRGGPEPDWERHVRYCENDVRMLAFVFDALAATERVAATNERPDTTQGSLGDFT